MVETGGNHLLRLTAGVAFLLDAPLVVVGLCEHALLVGHVDRVARHLGQEVGDAVPLAGPRLFDGCRETTPTRMRIQGGGGGGL